MEYLNKLVQWIRSEVNKANANGVIVGISGGVDSALVGYLAKKAFPNNSLGILLPINSERNFDLEHGLEFVNQFNLKHIVIDLEEEYIQLKNKINIKNSLIEGNIQSRLRMLTIYSYAQKYNYLVLGTDNKSEYDLGYFTKWGDGGCDLLPIVRLFKSEVFQYAKLVNIPQSILNKKPSAGFYLEQNDEDELKFSYNDYELYCNKEIKDKELILRIKNQIKKTRHKRKPIPKAPKKNKEKR